MQHFTKVVRLGTLKLKTRQVSVYCEIQYTDDGRLSISGVEGPRPNGDCYGACGQIDMHLRGHEGCIAPAPGWDLERLQKFFGVWSRWHLNDMRAGSPAQEEFLRHHADAWAAYRASALKEACGIENAPCVYPESYYSWACKVLAEAGLNPDPRHDGYRYGSAWLKEEVPEDVLSWLQALPDTNAVPAWI